MEPITVNKDDILANIGAMRQWLNEDRTSDPDKMVSDEQLEFWLFRRAAK